MGKASAKKPRQRSENEVLDQAVQQLLRETKAHARNTGEPIEPEQLRKDGFSDRFIAKVEKA